MKKTAFYAFMMAAVVGTSFTACHDSDGEDGEEGASYVFDSSSITIDESVIGKASAKSGVETYTLTSNMISVYCYNLGDKQTIIDNYIGDSGLTEDGLGYLADKIFGGFTPCAIDPNDENRWYLTPADTTDNAKNSSLICNPGTICKALFHKELAASATGLLSVALVKGPVCLYAAPITLYNELETNNADGLIDQYTALPAGDEIRLVVYGYIDSFNISNWSKTLDSFKGILTSVKNNGTKSANYVTLAKADANGKVTVNKSWQKLDLTDLEDFYCFECYIEVVKADGSVDSNYTLCDDLNFCSVKKISFDGRLGSLL